MSAPDMETRRVRALGARTHHVVGYGMIVMDDGSADENKRLPKVPAHVIGTLVGWGWVADDVEPVGVPELPVLTGRNKAALLSIAASEGVAVPEGATNSEIVKMVEQARAAVADTEGAAPV